MTPEREPDTGLAGPIRFSLPHGIIVLSAVISCVVVSTMGFMLIALMWRFGIPGPGWATGIGNEESIFSGVAFAGEVAAYGIFLIFITGPLTWFALSSVESRLRSIDGATFRARVASASGDCAYLFGIFGTIAAIPYDLHTLVGAMLTAAGLGALGGAVGGASLHLFSPRKKSAPIPDAFK